jgi:hypothetical protein
MLTNSDQSLVALKKGLHLQAFFYGRDKHAEGRLWQGAQALLIDDSHSGKGLGVM